MKIIDFRAKGVSLGVLSKVFLIVALVSAWVVQAAGLGKLTVSSYLGQPLNAEIALESVANKEIDSLSARLASPEVFQKAGVNLSPYHATLSVSVEKRTDGRPYIRIHSSQAISEPFLNLFIELHSSSGHLLREYNVLLDPAETQKVTTTALVVQQDKDKAENPAMPVSAAPRLSAETEKKSPVTQEKLPVQAGGIYGPVVRGDTLSRIARQISPDSVNLNQMLVALYRANRDAFLERNMNLLKVGVILRIPDESEILSVTTREASREVAVQKESWNNYRQRIAELAIGFSEESRLRQSQTGKIVTASEASSIEGSGKPEEVLILSKGELLGDNLSSVERAEDRIAQNYLHMMEEDATAKERALQEANERVAILEQNVAKLQRLLELKGSASEEKAGIESEPAQLMPDLQAIITPAPIRQQPDVAVDEDSTEIPDSTIGGAAGNPASPVTIPAQPVKPISLPELLDPASSESDEPALMDEWLQLVDENSTWAAAGLGALLVIVLGASVIRRKRASSGDSDADIYDYTEKDDEPVSSTLSEITSTDANSMEKPDEELVQRTAGTPESGDSDFADTADNHTADVDPGLFFGGKQDEKEIEPLFFTGDSVNQTDAEDSPVLGESDESDHTTGDGLAESDQPEYQKETFIDTEKAVEQWIFTTDNDDPSDVTQIQKDVEAHTLTHDEEHQIDFNLKLPKETELSQESRVMNELSGLDSSLANIDLNLGDKSDTEPQAVHENPEADIGMQWQEVATKLDLARAYLEMDDHEGARDILEEVLREGDDEQQSAARSMLDKIG